MSDYRIPDLPSDEELGITDEDREGDEAASAGSVGEPAKGRPGRAEGDRAPARFRLRGVVTLIAFLVVGWFASIRTGLPDPAPANAPDTAFSSARAMVRLIEIAREPRPTGSPEHDRVRGYLMDALGEMGLDAEVQTATSVFEGAGFARSATVRNVLARVPGTASTGAVLVTAHYDGVPLSPAAGDDGSGLVTVLEAVRALLADGPIRNDLIVLFTDGEELGLLGAEAFVDEHPWADDVDVVLSFEMRGAGGPSIMFETADENGWVVRTLREANPDAFATSLGDAFFRYLPNLTDFTVFERAGAQGLNFAAIDNAAVYHTPRDAATEVSESTLQHHGEHALAALRGLGSADLIQTRAPDVVYFTVPGLGLLVYDVRWVVPLSALILVLAAGALVLARRKGARPSAVLASVGVTLVAVSLGYGAGLLLVEWARGAHLEAGRLPGALFYGEGWYVLALGAVSLLIAAGAVALSRRWISVVELGLGAAILPVLACAGLAFLAPLAAMTVQWPTLALLVAVALLALLGTHAGSVVGWLIALLLALPVLASLVPTIEVLWLAGTLGIAGALGAAMVAALLLAAPALDALRSPNAWWAPACAIIVAAAAAGMGQLGAPVTAATPAGSTLLYVQDPEGAGTLWITDPRAADRVEDSDATVADSAPGVVWAADRAGVAFARTEDLSGIGYHPGTAAVAEAPSIDLPGPLLVVFSDSTLGLVRRMRLGVRSRVGAERLYIGRSGASGARIVGIGGHALADPESLVWVDHWGAPDTMVVVDLEMAAGSALDLVIAEHHLRPGEILGPGTFARPADLVPDAGRASDRAILVTRFQPAGLGAVPSDTLPTDTVPSDALPTDALPTDTVPTDTLPSDTMLTDTLPPDTLPTDTVPMPADSAGPGARVD